MSLLTGLLALVEILLFSFLGQLVDWLNEQRAEALLVEESATLIHMGFMALDGGFALNGGSALHGVITVSNVCGHDKRCAQI